MRRSLSIALFVSLLACGSAKATCPVIPFIFANGTPFNAAQVNANFDSVNRCVSTVTGPTTVTVASNAELTALSTVDRQAVIRLDYAAGVGAPATIYKPGTVACAIAGGDGGSQVPSADGKCWIASFSGGLADVRVWGAQASTGSIDAGPAIRAASLYSETTGTAISVPAGTFYLNTLDAEGTGALVFGKVDHPVPGPGYPLPTFHTMPNFVGQTWHNDPNMCFITEPTFILGNGLNRPLVYLKNNSTSARLEYLCLSGNRINQAGYGGGPGGKLFAVVAEATAETHPSSSLIGKNIAIRDGYQGNLFYGSGRGVLYLTDIWSLYSGQDLTDYGVYIASYDAIIYNIQQGLSTGFGIYDATGGINHTFTAGGTFSNVGVGMYVSGGVTDLQIQGMRFQANGRQGLMIGNEAPLAGQQVGGRMYTALAFNNNSAEGDNLYDDVAFLGNAVFHDTFVATSFMGPQDPATQPKPRYNIGVQSGVRVNVLGAMPSDGANASGFTNDFTSLVGDYQYVAAWVPHLQGLTTPGVETPTAGWPKATWSRAGKTATVTGNIKLDAFTGTGDILVANFPFISKPGVFSTCSLGRTSGLAPAATFTNFSMAIGENTTTAGLYKSGPTVPTDEVVDTDITYPMELSFTCIYPIIDGN